MSQAATSAQPLEYLDYITIVGKADPGLANAVAEFHGVEQVLQWMQLRGLHKPALDMVGQDEFSYDFLLELEPGGRWLVFGVT